MELQIGVGQDLRLRFVFEIAEDVSDGMIRNRAIKEAEDILAGAVDHLSALGIDYASRSEIDATWADDWMKPK